MPKKNKTAKKAVKFDPREQNQKVDSSVEPKVGTTVPEKPPVEAIEPANTTSTDDNKPEVEPVKPVEPAEQVASEDILSLVSKLTEQIASLTSQVADLSSGQSKMEDDVETYRKETVAQKNASKAKVEKTILDKKTVMKNLWEKQARIQMFIPFENKEKRGARFTVQANGYMYIHKDGKIGIPKGVYVPVPTGVFEIASNSLNQSIENMGFDNRIDMRETTSEGKPFDPEKLER